MPRRAGLGNLLCNQLYLTSEWETWEEVILYYIPEAGIYNYR